LIPRLVEIYRRIDHAYSEAVKSVGFSCEGCDGTKCCTVDLKISTLVEMSYLRQGFNTLSRSEQQEILARCSEIIRAKEGGPASELYRNSVCALNSDGMCVLYDYRPMICRLHGMPYFFVGQRNSVEQGDGCPRFTEVHRGQDTSSRIDRTQFYREMAVLEVEAVRLRGERTEKRTVAETLVMMPD
jgi:hypothetical protein